jgi:hypothetical protein
MRLLPPCAFVVAVAVVVAALRLGGAEPVARADDAKKPDTTTTDKKAPPLQREEAEKLVRDFIFTEHPKMNPRTQFPLKEVTPRPVWQRLGAQVFQVTEGSQQHETFVIRGKKVYRIGKSFGGQGVRSMVVADPGGDGRDKLIFAYAWGSGEHRSQVAVLDVLAKEPQQVSAPQAYFGDLGDLEVKNGEGGEVEIYAGLQELGRLTVAGKEGALKAAIRLKKDLPEQVTKGFRELE